MIVWQSDSPASLKVNQDLLPDHGVAVFTLHDWRFTPSYLGLHLVDVLESESDLSARSISGQARRTSRRIRSLIENGFDLEPHPHTGVQVASQSLLDRNASPK